MSYALTDDQNLIQQDASDFAKQFLVPAIKKLDQTGEFPKDIVDQMAQHDFFGLFLPDTVGGAGAGYLSYVLAVESLAGASGAVASILVNHGSACYAIDKYGTDAQKKKYLANMAAGTLLGAVAVAENGPALGMGHDAAIAAGANGGYTLNGTKPYVANAGVAGVYVVFACTDPAEGARSLTAFLVDAKAAGVTVGAAKENMGMHGRPTADVTFKDVKLGAEDLLGKAGAGEAIAADCLAAANVAEAAITLGIAQSGLKIASQYSKQRVQFKKPISTFQAIQTLLADVAVNVHLARLAIYDAAALIEKAQPFAREAAIVKSFAGRIGMEALIDSVQVEGGYGYSEDMPLPRLFRDLPGSTLRDKPGDYPEHVIAASIS